MNYSQYLQQGGTALPSIEEQVAQLVQAAMSGDQEAGQQIELIMQAAQQGDPKAQQLAQLIQQIAQKLQSVQLPAAMKCGGKVRAKIKKACGGKKMEKGGETPVKKMSKGCPCTLKKVGGRLIEVDCNGIPVAKDGTKIVKASLGTEFYNRLNPENKAKVNNILGIKTPSSNKYNRPGGIFADTNLSDKSLAGRQQWVRDNADYLKSLGWTDDRIAGYRGATIQDNLDLLAAINGKAAWDQQHAQLTEESVGAAAGAASPAAEAASSAGAVTPGAGVAGAAEVVGAELETPTDEYVRSRFGVYQNAAGDIDWARSASVQGYERAVNDAINNPYRLDRNMLRQNRRDIIASKGLKGYWDMLKALKEKRNAARTQGKQAVADYRNQYIANLSGQIGQQTPAGTAGSEVAMNEIAVNPNDYFQYGTDVNGRGRFKQGGIISYKDYLNI